MRKMTSQVTRASVMELARLPHHNLHVVERELPMADVLDMIRWLLQTFSIIRSGGKLPKNIFPIFFPIFPGAVSCWRCLRLGPRPALSRCVDNKTPCVLTFFTWFFNLMVLLGARLGACSTKGRW